MKLQKQKSYVVELTPEEVELLYDALDARTDRLENWLRGVGCDALPTPTERASLEKDLSDNVDLEKAFQPLIQSIRGRDSDSDRDIERISDKFRTR